VLLCAEEIEERLADLSGCHKKISASEKPRSPRMTTLFKGWGLIPEG
jgi:hypothetical protein